MVPLITLPALFCPFASTLNRHAEVVERDTIAWANRFHLLDDDDVRRRLCSVRVGWLVAHAYPNASCEGLQLLTDWTTWLFLQDDQCDENGIGKQPDRLAALHARSLEVLRGAQLTANDRALSHALLDLRQRMEQYHVEGWMPRFIRSFESSLNASIWEATNRQRGVIPDVATYMNKRAFTGGLYTHIVLQELTENLQLPAAVREHSVIQQLTRMTVNVVCWANDLFSLMKEINQGDVHNLVLSLQHKHPISLQEAVDRAAALHDTEVRAFIELALRVPSFGTEVDAELKRYIAILRSWMRGNLDWSYMSGRYPLPETITTDALWQP
jgi:5-epi-alpha-selinene synthase